MNKNIIYFSIFLICAYSYIWYVIKRDKNSLINKFTDKMVVISSIFVPIGIYLTYTVFSLQLEESRINSTFRIIDRSWLNINKIFVDYYDKCPTFINSLGFDWHAVNYISICIFQAFEDFETSAVNDETGHYVWIANFLQWTNSEILRNNWSVLKSNFSDTTQKFGDYLFLMSSIYRNQITNVAELNNIAKTLADSEEFKNIIEARHKSDL